MSNKLFAAIIALIIVIGIFCTSILFLHTKKLKDESSIITIVANERW